MKTKSEEYKQNKPYKHNVDGLHFAINSCSVIEEL